MNFLSPSQIKTQPKPDIDTFACTNTQKKC